MNFQTGDTERRKHHCLARSITGTRTTSDCRSTKKFYCVGGANGDGIWSHAIYTCIRNDSLLSNDRRNNQDYWLSYFMYEEYEDEQCVAILRNDSFLSLTNQFIPCSEHLPVLCNDEQNSVNPNTPVFANQGVQFSTESTESTSNRSLGPTVKNTSNLQRHDETNEEMVIVNVVLFGMCVIIITMVILRKRLSAKFCQTAGKKFRRKKINKKQMVQTDRNCDEETDNKNRAVRDIYNDPWELRNIVQQGDLNLQEIIDDSIDETET